MDAGIRRSGHGSGCERCGPRIDFGRISSFPQRDFTVAGARLPFCPARLSYTLNVREPLLKPLHEQQIGLLTQWRAMPATSPDRQEALIQLLLNINAVAAGLKTTG
jgi:hypothetical protein